MADNPSLLESRGFYASNALAARAILKFWIFLWQPFAPAKPAYMPSMAISVIGLTHRHGAYVQDVLYADFAGAKIGDTAIAKKDNF